MDNFPQITATQLKLDFIIQYISVYSLFRNILAW